MFIIKEQIKTYLDYCRVQKGLSEKTIKAYTTDLTQFSIYADNVGEVINRNSINDYVAILNKHYKPKSSKRKIACIKSFYSYLEYEGILTENPFSTFKLKLKESIILPRTISFENIKKIFTAVYNSDIQSDLMTEYQYKSNLRDIAVLELLFATGLRVSELCSIKTTDVDLKNGKVRIYGKGNKERMLQITNKSVLSMLKIYQKEYKNEISQKPFFFYNKLGNPLSEQSVRTIINKYASISGIKERITPHMFRHTFATMLLEEDVDIRYIQKMLGHSSILTTQIYTYVTDSKQRKILAKKHPRNKIKTEFSNNR